MSEGYLLDASAVLALLGNEPGSDLVVSLLPDSTITALNLAEVVKKLRERGVPADEVAAIVSDIQIPIEPGPGDEEQALELGELAAAGRAFGLSMGDSVCLKVAEWSGRTAVTTERRWAEAAPRASQRYLKFSDQPN
jgi:PIN domain nuclease of toxin-antitoxin system